MKHIHTTKYLIIFAVVIALIFGIDWTIRRIKLENTDPNTVIDEAFDEVIERDLGFTPEEVKEQAEFDEAFLNEKAKVVTEYRTLAEAEEDMGYYLGFHNTLESIPGYHLVAMYNVGDKSWFQAIYEHEYPDTYGVLVVKVSKNVSRETLISPYTNQYDIETKTIHGVNVEYKYVNDLYCLTSFSVPNGKSYSLYISTGITVDEMNSLLIELIDNLKSMEDWEY